MRRQPHTESALLAKIESRFGVSGKNEKSARNSVSTKHLALGIGDDAALFRPTRGHETILTCDWFLEGTHFLRDKHPADSVGWKSLARAVSDIAAMGGVPRCFLLSLALPIAATGKWLTAFLDGLHRAANSFRCELAGGDTTRRNEILINITVLGEVKKRRALQRDTAKPGDAIFVSGRLGEAEKGLQLLRNCPGSISSRDPQLRKHLYPEPRLALAQWLVDKRLATSAMDLSDGLSTDLARLCSASQVGARIDAEKIPLVNLASANSASRQKATAPRSVRHVHRGHMDEALELALHGGDDYELLFTVPQKKSQQIPPTFGGLPILSIGEITKRRDLTLVGATRMPTKLTPRGWDPFQKR